ncbi:hypothetical protein LX64_03573 [Chitinophaga skermanii]|uniref:Uncharacterized protein n=1 Tax=Chitinophaga skermanii TaxID=331697 RepID=A0A327QGU6_9BACT|nr:hypothetical protein [Chitinophaga skermanii]RAJ02553.1 hypothetical protein LX64_03573 [Chitinophaga skermanii]
MKPQKFIFFVCCAPVLSAAFATWVLIQIVGKASTPTFLYNLAGFANYIGAGLLITWLCYFTVGSFLAQRAQFTAMRILFSIIPAFIMGKIIYMTIQDGSIWMDPMLGVVTSYLIPAIIFSWAVPIRPTVAKKMELQ